MARPMPAPYSGHSSPKSSSRWDELFQKIYVPPLWCVYRLVAFPAPGACLEIDTLGGRGGLFRLNFGTVRYSVVCSAYSEGGACLEIDN